MKSKWKSILIIFVFSIFIMIIGGITGFYTMGHDTDFHLANIKVISEELSFGKLLVQEPLKLIANDFGYGTRFFYPPLPHLLGAYIVKALTIFGINNAALGMKIIEWVCFLLSGITFFYLANKIFKSEKIGMLLSLFYMSAPYHIMQVFIRGAFSEMFIPIAIPLIILGLLYLTEKKYKHFLISFVAGYVIAIYSHMAMTIYFTLMILVTFFIIYFKQIFNKKNILYLLLACILILLLTISFWGPLLEFKINGDYRIFVPYLLTGKGDLRYSTLRPDELLPFSDMHAKYLVFHLQMFVTIMIFAGVFLIFKRKLWKEKIYVFLTIFTILAVIMVTPIFPWKYTPSILQTLQFPWRLALYFAFTGILFSGVFIKQFEGKKYFNIICYVFIGLALLSSFYYTGHLDKDDIDLNDIDYSKGLGNEAEYLPAKMPNNRKYLSDRTNDIIIKSGRRKYKYYLK